METSIEKRVAELENLVFLSKNVLSFDEASKFLNLSKSYLYKLTAKKEVPFRKYGNKLLFSRKELLTWAENLAKRVNDKDEAALAIAKSANRKIRNYGK